MIDGQIVLWKGRFPNLNLASIRTQIEAAREDMAIRNQEARQIAEALEEHLGQFCIGLSRQPYHVHAMAGPDY